MKNSEKIKIHNDILELKELSKVRVLRTGEKIEPSLIIPNKLGYGLYKNEKKIEKVVKEQEAIVKDLRETYFKEQGFEASKELKGDEIKAYVNYISNDSLLKDFLNDESDPVDFYQVKISLDHTTEAGVVSLPDIDPNELFKISLIPTSILDNIFIIV